MAITIFRFDDFMLHTLQKNVKKNHSTRFDNSETLNWGFSSKIQNVDARNEKIFLQPLAHVLLLLLLYTSS